MKLVNSHVLNVDGVGEVIENFMMYNGNFDAIPFGRVSYKSSISFIMF